MNNEMFQNIFDKLQDGMPAAWDKVVLYVAYFEGSYSMKYYVRKGKSEYVDCYNLEGMTNSKLIKLFMALDKIIAPERETLGKKKWSVMTLIVDSEGDFKTDFDYKDISADSLEYEEKWEKKYLK